MLDLHSRRALREDTVSVDGGKISTRQALVGLVVMVVLAAVAVAVVIRGTGPSDEEARVQARASSTPTPDQSPSRSAPRPTAKATTPLPTTLPTAAPEGVSWSFFQGYALPSSKTAGPLRVNGPVHAGYAQSPEGALLAAVQIDARRLLTEGNSWRRVVEEQTVPSAGQDAFVEARATVDDVPVVPGEASQIAGFRFVTYSPDVAVIQFASRGQNGVLEVATNTVRWQDGDWKLEFQPDGGTSTPLQPAPDLAGFTIWGGS